jgi:hypothetical protein
VKQEHIREFRESVFCFVTFTVLFLIYSVIVELGGHRYSWGKILNSFIVGLSFPLLPFYSDLLWTKAKKRLKLTS